MAILGGEKGVLEKGYRQDARTDFDAKYVKRRGSAQKCLLGVAKKYPRFGQPFSPKPPFSGPISTSQIFFARKLL